MFSKKILSTFGAAFIVVLPLTINEKPASAVTLAPSTNIVSNGSFEQPNLGFGWGVFSSIPGWNLLPGSSGIEVQNRVAGTSFNGTQHVELDSHGVSGIFQDLETKIGQTYRLQFAFSARPGVVDNLLNIKWANLF